MIRDMKTLAKRRLRPMRTMALFGIASMAAVPVSVARAGTEEPALMEATIGLATDNAAGVDLIPQPENISLCHKFHKFLRFPG